MNKYVITGKYKYMVNFLYNDDLPDDLEISGDIAIDTETKGLNIVTRDRLCVVQLSNGDGNAHLVKFSGRNYDAPNLKKLLSDESRTMIFHYARFDVAAIKIYLGIDVKKIYCTKIASRLARTYTDRHGLKDLCKEFARVDLSKQQQCSNWGAASLSKEQVKYAASDVLHLHILREKLNIILEDEDRSELAEKCFDFIPTRVEMDIGGWEELDIFHH